MKIQHTDYHKTYTWSSIAGLALVGAILFFQQVEAPTVLKVLCYIFLSTPLLWLQYTRRNERPRKGQIAGYYKMMFFLGLLAWAALVVYFFYLLLN